MLQTEIRQKIHQQIDQLPSDLLLFVAEFLEFLKLKRARTAEIAAVSPPLEAEVDQLILTGSTGADLMPFVGTWQGDDFEECLETVYQNRAPAEFRPCTCLIPTIVVGSLQAKHMYEISN